MTIKELEEKEKQLYAIFLQHEEKARNAREQWSPIYEQLKRERLREEVRQEVAKEQTISA